MKFIITLLTLLSFTSTSAQTFTATAYIDQQISCHGRTDGYINIMAYPAVTTMNPQFTYILSSSDTTISNNHGMFLNLPAGEYAVCATLDSESICHALTIVEPDSIIINPTTENPVTCGMSDGVISLEITGGTTDLQPYVVTWKGSAGNVINNPTEYFSMYEDNLSYDIYKITVEDDRGCFAEKTYPILKQGDINGDGNVDLIDLSAMEQLVSIFGYYYRADIVKDGNIDLYDLATLENIMINPNCN